MTASELMSELHKLSRAEKLRIIQMLANELAQEELALDPNAVYEVWSPYDSAEAAATLAQVLEAHEKSTDE